MKRIICILYIVAVFLASCKITTKEMETNHYTEGIYQLTFHTKLISNDWVGQDWSFTYVCENQEIKSGFRYPLPFELFMFLPIDVTVREHDKIDDVGTGRIKVPLVDGCTGKTRITVTESSGRFKGNTAVWEITCTAKLVDMR